MFSPSMLEYAKREVEERVKLAAQEQLIRMVESQYP